MKITTTTDLRAALAKLDKVGGFSSQLLRREVTTTARAFTREIATQWTPPAGPDLKGTPAKKAGEAAVQRDIRRLFPTASAAYASLPQPQAAQFWALLKRGQLDRATALLRTHTTDARLRNAPLSRRPDPTLHHRARRRGIVPRSTPAQQIITDPRPLSTYIRQQQRRVGLLASGWLAAARYFKIKLPAWVERHSTHGSIAPSLLPARTLYRITNNAPHNGDLPRKATRLAEIKMNQLRRRLPFAIRAEIKKLTR